MNEWRRVFVCGGYEMRSYSETRWASIMDSLEITWLYEPHNLMTRHGIYKPDFFLPKANIYLEVKGNPPTQVEIEKGHDVEAQTGRSVLFSYGRPRLEHNQLTGGTISYYRAKRPLHFGTIELGDIIKIELSDKVFLKYLNAGRHTAKPPYTNTKEIATNYVLSILDRAELERHLERQHSPLNQSKLSITTMTSKPETALSYLNRRLQELSAARLVK